MNKFKNIKNNKKNISIINKIDDFVNTLENLKTLIIKASKENKKRWNGKN